jgi:beta-carotene 3-hydroxylase
MDILLNVGIVSATCFAMEAVAWAVHKYIMHKWAWGWHKSHHAHHEHSLEKNDLFGVLFALISISVFLLARPGYDWLFWVGIGMTVYGCMYFVVHDGLTHGRWPLRWVPRQGYLKRLVQAHRLHHAVDGPENGISFGFLYAPPPKKLSRLLRERRRAGTNTSKHARL